MFRYALRRLLHSLVTVFIVLTLVFLLMRLLPVEGYFGERADKLTPAQKEAILRKLGLLDPWYVQIKNFYGQLLRGDLGTSVMYRVNVPVRDILVQKIPYSFAFGLAALVLSLTLGFAMGIHMVQNKGLFWDKLWTTYIVFMNAVPGAVYLLFIQLYGTSVTRLPMLFDRFDPRTWILPVISMALGGIAGNAMWLRRFMVDEINKDYIRLARAKGMSNRAIMVKHVLRNAFVPLAQYLPTSVLSTIAGSIYVESLYSIPGMGGLLVTAITLQDNPLVQALVLIYSTIGVVGLFLGDIMMAILDPRIRLEKQGGAR